jgi:hypothetical protein
MRKRLAVTVLILVSILNFAWSVTVSSVYNNVVASEDFNELPRVGTQFKDDKNNVLIVNSSSEKVVIFDKISTRLPVEVGSKLTYAGNQHLLFLRTSLNQTSLGWSVSTALYPLKPLVLTGVTYSFNYKSFDGVYLTAGFETDVPLSKLWDTSFTLIEDGGIVGWCAAGILIKNNVAFVCTYGLSYRHFVGTFRWEVGYTCIESPNKLKYSSVFLGVGVSL